MSLALRHSKSISVAESLGSILCHSISRIVPGQSKGPVFRMYHKTTKFDPIVPRLLAGLEVTRRDIAILGHDGFCSSCSECRYFLCSFGKG